MKEVTRGTLENLRPKASGHIVLASASPSRARILECAGVPFNATTAHIDERSVKESLKAEGARPLEVAETLAELKARRVSESRPDALVIGADQILECDGSWFDKPEDLAQAAAHLRVLSGRTHELATAVCVVEAGRRVWHHRESPSLTMRTLSEGFIHLYLDKVGEDVLTSVGAYQLEGAGAQLFERIEGDFFSILGLPLLPLMRFLRDRGLLMT
jgi:septum formation protein